MDCMKPLFLNFLMVSAAAALIAATGCATVERSNDNAQIAASNPRSEIYNQHAGEPQARVEFQRLDHWRAINRDQIVVRSRENGYFLLTLDPLCAQELAFASGFGISVEQSTLGTLRELDRIYTRDSSCLIRSIRPVDHAAVKAELAERGIEEAFIQVDSKR
jgi:hypothetical protein